MSAYALLAADAGTQFQALLQQVREAEQAKDYTRTAGLYERIVRLRPRDPVANQNLGLAWYLKGSYSKALPPLEKAVSLEPSLWTAWLYLGICRYRTNDFAEASKALERAEHLNPENQPVHYWLGAAQLALKFYPEAITQLESAVQAAPSDQESLYLLARACAEYSAALLGRLLQESPQSAAAHRVRAEDALEEGLLRPAVVELRKALTLDPDNPALKQLLAEVERAIEAEETAEPAVVRVLGPPAAQIETQLREKTSDPDALYLLGRAYQSHSAELGRRLFEMDPDSYRVRLMQGEAYEKGETHHYPKALEEYERALELKPDLPGVNYAIGRVLWKMRRWGEAVPYLKKELEKNRNHGLANYYLGSSYLFSQQNEQAIVYLEAAVRAQPRLGQALRELGRALAKEKRYEDAIGRYRQLLELDPDDPSVHALMATAFRALGRMDEARRYGRLAGELSAKKNKPLE